MTSAPPSWRIQALAKRPDLIPALAEALWECWGAVFPEKTVAVRTAGLHARTNPDRLPTTVVATATDGALLGTASILFDDMETRPDLNPWLATVFVMPGQRGHGLGPRSALPPRPRLGGSACRASTSIPSTSADTMPPSAGGTSRPSIMRGSRRRSWSRTDRSESERENLDLDNGAIERMTE